ncbi:MAG TPA: Ig-like domain repeat protein, partial [Acidimicrobiales bacterium]|nr:Ig-like domain repeat protein [Acidimicrobiales bacterium]
MSRLARRSIALALPIALALSGALVASPAGATTGDTITMFPAPSPASPVYGDSVTLSALVSGVDTSSPGPGTVAFQYYDGSAWTTIAACSAQTVTPGGGSGTATCVTTALPAVTVDVRANYSGDNSYSASAGTQFAYTVAKHASTISITNAAPTSPAAPGTQVTITATVGSGQTAGKVQFDYSLDGSTYVAISGCTAQSVSGTTATCVTTGLPIGTVDLSATYQTDPNFLNQTSAAFAYAVKTAATVSLGAGPSSPVVSGTSVTLTATVGTGETGTVTMKSSPDGVTFTTIAACSAVAVSGTTAICVTTTIPAGTLFLQAVYNGNVNFATATSASLSYAVTGSTASTITLAAVPAGPVAFNTSVALTATLASSLQTGTVLFASSPDGTTYTTIAACAAVTISATHATCTTTALPDGTRFVRAVYSGNTSYVSATSAAVGLIVSGTTASSVSLGAAPASPVANGTSVLLTATVGASAETGSVAFEYSVDGSNYTVLSACAAQAVSGTAATCTTTALPAGTVDVEAVYAGNATYLGNASFATVTSAAVPYAIQKGASTLGLGASPTGRVS